MCREVNDLFRTLIDMLNEKNFQELEILLNNQFMIVMHETHQRIRKLLRNQEMTTFLTKFND